MSDKFIGLENIPNVYITRITLEDCSVKDYYAVIRLQLQDAKKSNGFTWKDDEIFRSSLRVALVVTKDLTLSKFIKGGSVIPVPSIVVKQDTYNPSTTSIHKYSIGNFIKSGTENKCYYDKKIKIPIPFTTSNCTVFAVCYLDTLDTAAHYQVDLGGSLKRYCGATTSEIIIQNDKIPALTNVFVESNNQVWPGPVANKPGVGYVGGSDPMAANAPILKQLKVNNIKLSDNRSKIGQKKIEPSVLNSTLIGDLYYSVNEEINLNGIFALNVSQFALQKTKYGKIMASVSQTLFEEFMSSFSINSMAITRQQVKTLKTLNRVGTPQITPTKVDSYKTVAVSVDESPNSLKTTENIQQIYLNNDFRLRYYQFEDRDFNFSSRGQYVYKVEVTFADKSQHFMEVKIKQIQNKIGLLKGLLERLNRRKNYDYKRDRLKGGFSIPSSVVDIFKVYAITKSYLVDMDGFEINNEVAQLVSNFTTENYTAHFGLKFLTEFQSMATKFQSIFKVRNAYGTTTKPKNNKKASIPNLISLEKTFKDIIQFNDYTSYYQYIDKQFSMSSTISRTDFKNRAEFEATRFFDVNKSFTPEEFSTLDNETSKAITDTHQASQMFLAPLEFRFRHKVINLRDLSNIDYQGLTYEFLGATEAATHQIRSWEAPKKKAANTTQTRANSKMSKPAKKYYNRSRGVKKTFTPSFKVPSNNLKATAQSGDPMQNSTTYLGSGSAFNNPEGNTIEPPFKPLLKISRSLLGAVRLGKTSNKFNFDMKTRNSKVGSYIRTKFFKKSKVKKAPVAWKAMVCSRSPAAKNEILKTEGDILQNPETKVGTEMIFQTSQKLEILLGYEKDRNGDSILSAPVWTEIDESLLPAFGGAICRLNYAEIPELGIETNNLFKLPYTNKVFIISDDSVTKNITQFSESIFPFKKINMESKNRLSLSMKFATTNIVMQSPTKDPIKDPSLVAPSSTAVGNSMTTTPSSTSSPASGFSGGGMY